MPSQTPPLAPIILITPGDPAGIGPEIVLKALVKPHLFDICRPLVVADIWVMREVSRRLRLKSHMLRCDDAARCAFEAGQINAIDVKTDNISNLIPGQPQALAAKSAVSSIHRAVHLALQSQAQAIVTGPINKESLRLGDYPWIGHTEMLQDLTKSPSTTTLFVTGPLRIFFATRHVSLQQAIGSLKKPLLYATIIEADLQTKRLGFSSPRLAVAGLNPHAGDAGLFGREEIDEIKPAVRQAREAGIHVDGPIPADSVFHKCITGAYDAVVALTHDQGHIAAKTFDFYRTVGVTLGLPFVRTSVDHGTAFDIAWQGKANPTSLEEAVTLAVDLVRRRWLFSDDNEPS